MSDWGWPYVWGATQRECARTYPCDAYLLAPDHRFYRALDVGAPAPLTFRWLQQLRIAPYSYDWADNFALPSPGRLTARAGVVAPGQRMMHVFVIREFVAGEQLTLGPASRAAEAVLGTLYGTYVVEPLGAHRSRLFVKVNASYPRSPYGRLVAPLMPWIDLFMMRQQLRTLRRFIERDACRQRDRRPALLARTSRRRTGVER